MFESDAEKGSALRHAQRYEHHQGAPHAALRCDVARGVATRSAAVQHIMERGSLAHGGHVDPPPSRARRPRARVAAQGAVGAIGHGHAAGQCHVPSQRASAMPSQRASAMPCLPAGGTTLNHAAGTQ